MNNYDRLRSKIIDTPTAKLLVNQWKKQGERVVFTNGCFDLIHLGHIDYLAHASMLGNRLIIGLNTDRSVKRLKGRTRPVQDEFARAMVLSSIFFVDAVVLFEEDTPLEIIKELVPDILVKGSDYEIHQIVGADVVIANGGSVETIDFVEGYSTTAIINKLKKD